MQWLGPGIMRAMKPPLYVGPLSSKQRQRLESGLRSRDGFELRRCQILLASACGERPCQIAAHVGGTAQTVRNTLRAYRADNAGCFRARSTRPTPATSLLNRVRCGWLRAMLHQRRCKLINVRFYDAPRFDTVVPILAMKVRGVDWQARTSSYFFTLTKSAFVREAYQPVDARPAGRRLLRAGPDPRHSQCRVDPPRPAADGGELGMGQALDHQPGPALRLKKTRVANLA